MTGWPTRPLGTVAAISKEKVEPADHPERVFNYVGLEHIEGHTGRLLPGADTIGAEIKSTKHIFHKDEILYGKLRPYLNKVHLADRTGICSTDILVLKPKAAAAVPAFVTYFLRSPVVLAQVAGLTQGANLPRLSPTSLLKLPVPTPPLPEQNRIVSILDAAEELRCLRKQADRRTADLIPALFHEMFGDPATNPKGWPEHPLGELCEVKGGKRLPKGDEYACEPTPFRYIRVSDFSSGVIDESNLLWLKPETQKQIARYTVGTGDIVISIAGTIGLIAPVPSTLVGANLTENAAKLVSKRSGTYDPIFLSELLRAPYAQGQIGSHTGQVTIGKLALFRIEKLRVFLPPLSLQRDFAARVAGIRAMEADQTTSRRRLDDLFQSLLCRAFQGDL